MDDSAAWSLEKRLWLEGPAVYADVLDPACLMAFPGMGVMRAAAVLNSLKDAPRWQSVAITDRTVGRAGSGIVILGYRAEGHRESGEVYRCFCTSTYRNDGGTWKLVQHQQTMAG